MDFNGITWAGNIYQKFEAMCLEVEEVMHEDTVKYVENQVEKVGVSVKKFYAEIMQDLLPTPCADPMKVADGDLSVKPYARTDINKRPKSSALDIHGEPEKKENVDEDSSDLTAEESSLIVHNDTNLLSPLSRRIPVENTLNETCSAKSKKVGSYKRAVGIKRISKNNHPPKVSRVVTSSSRNGSRLQVNDLRKNFLETSGDMNVTMSSEILVRNNLEEAIKKHFDACAESFRSDQNLSAKSARQETNNPQPTSSTSDKTSFEESVRHKKDDSECNSSSRGVFAEPIETFRKDCSVSQIQSDIGSGTCEAESLGDEVIVSLKDNFNLEVIETEDIVEPKTKIAEQSKLEESCVLVELDKLQFISPETKMHKSYKKMIREALSSKLRSTRKQERHVFQYKDSTEENEAGSTAPALALTMNHDKRRSSPAHDPSESDWELL